VCQTGLSPAISADSELLCEILIAEQQQPCMQSPLLRFHPTGMQITESPGDSHCLQPVSSVMPDLASDPRHRVAADAVAATGLKTLHSSDQPIAAFLHQIVAFT
tara:strand:- start:340 stop:651 length:312 start_codon:yes stop_codon:yes gene_type:complete